MKSANMLYDNDETENKIDSIKYKKNKNKIKIAK